MSVSISEVMRRCYASIELYGDQGTVELKLPKDNDKIMNWVVKGTLVRRTPCCNIYEFKAVELLEGLKNFQTENPFTARL